MSESWITDLTKSAEIFKHLVYPKIQKWLGKGKLIPVERITDEKDTDLLDSQAGIDGWHVEYEKGIRGIASRVQYDNDWGSFTIRYERASGRRTEYEKLKHAIKHKWLYPHYFSQSYVELPENFDHKNFNYEEEIDKIKLLNIGLTKTVYLIEYYENGLKNFDWYYDEVTHHGKATFIVIPWKFFEEKYELQVYDRRVLDSFVRYSCEIKLINKRKRSSPFPYSDTDPRPKMCKWSGDGYIHCTASIRKERAKICDTCSQNPDKKEVENAVRR